MEERSAAQVGVAGTEPEGDDLGEVLGHQAAMGEQGAARPAGEGGGVHLQHRGVVVDIQLGKAAGGRVAAGVVATGRGIVDGDPG